MGFKPFQENESCSKCGHKNISIKYIPQNNLPGGFKLEEHFECVCMRCGYNFDRAIIKKEGADE